jgi:hypothetical protein
VTPNPFDQACRYLAKRNVAGLLGWLLPGLPPAPHFAGWLDTRSIPFPGEPERACDTVAHLVDNADPLMHWALVLEFQREADPDMFGRFLEYLGRLWRELRVPGRPTVRFRVGAALVNLAGQGRASLTVELPGTAVRTALEVEKKNLVDEDTAATLERIAAWTVDRCVLPWIPLMHGGGTPGIIARWKALAEAEPDAVCRGDWGGLVLVFADAAGTRPQWKRALEDWNVETSQQVLEWQAEARAKGRIEGKAEAKAEDVVSALRVRFPKKVSKKLHQAIMQSTDLEQLDHWHKLAITAETLDAFRAAAHL